MDGNVVWRFPEGSGRQERVERYCCNVICGAPTTSEVKGLRWDEMKIVTVMYLKVPDSPEQTQGHAQFLTEQETGENPVLCRQKGHEEVSWCTTDYVMVQRALEPHHILVQIEAHFWQTEMLSWNSGPNISIVCSIAYQLSMTMPSIDYHMWNAMYCLINSQLSLKQRNQFSICHRTRSLVQTQYMQRSIKQEVNQWQRNLKCCFTACGGRRLSHKNSSMHP